MMMFDDPLHGDSNPQAAGEHSPLHHNLAAAVAQRSAMPQSRRVKASFPFALLLSILLHGALLAIVWAAAPPMVRQAIVQPIMLFTRGYEGVDEDTSPLAMAEPLPAHPLSGETEVESAPVEISEIQLLEVEEVSIPAAPISLPPAEAEPVETTPLIGLGPSSINLTAPSYLPTRRSAPIASETKAEFSAPAPTMAASVPSKFTAPKVVRGFAGRRGVRNGLDGRGIPLPDYPAESRQRGEEGVVELQLTISPNGTIAEVKVIRDPGYPALVRSAIAAVRAARFDPAHRDGIPVEGTIIIPFRFSLD